MPDLARNVHSVVLAHRLGAPERDAGQHRLHGEAGVDRVLELLRLKDLLGLSLDELRDVVTAEEARGPCALSGTRAIRPSNAGDRSCRRLRSTSPASSRCCASGARGSTITRRTADRLAGPS
ncbi:MAG: hypothetical protein WKF48_01180 [Solirubrobacteraceae bacterium]